MATRRHLPKAPITEALVDFRVTLPKATTPQAFQPVVESLKQRFPNVQELRSMEAVLEMKDGVWVQPQTNVGAVRGYVLRSQDNLNVAQFRTDGFTFSRLRPYTRWEDVFPQALELWSLYIDAASPGLVTRIATRYINHIRIPGERVDFDDYLIAGPDVPSELPQTIGGFLIRIVLLDPEVDIAANVTQALERRTDPRFTTVILDIDAYRVREWIPRDPAIVETFALLREFKNRVFFSHITENTARLFE